MSTTTWTRTTFDDLLRLNKEWAETISEEHPRFFPQSAEGQTPHTLWIGCSDSRVPESVITKAWPGDIFVQRNIANQVHLDDRNLLSVLDYAVTHLHVQHVVVVGHTSCGGADACLKATQRPNFNPVGPVATLNDIPAEAPLNRWLEPLTKHVASLDGPCDISRVVEENVKLQVKNLSATEVINNVWKSGTPKGRRITIHGWVHDLATGRLRDLGISRDLN